MPCTVRSSSAGISDRAYPNHSGGYCREPHYLVGIDETKSSREKTQQLYGDNPEIMDAVAQLDEYFSDRSFESRPEVQNFVGWVRRSTDNPEMADEIASEIINEGYITAINRLGYRDAPVNVAFSKSFAENHGTSFADAFMFGPGGAARIALAGWLVKERLHGMYRPGKAPSSTFSREAKRIWYEAEDKRNLWPEAKGEDGEFGPTEVRAEQGKLPQGTEELLRDSWRRYLYQGKDYAYKGTRRLCGDQNYQMIEDMVGVLLEAEASPKMYRSPLSHQEQLRYNRIVEDANKHGVDPFRAVYHQKMFSDPDDLKPAWNRARRILYEYSGIMREAAMDAGLMKAPASTGVTWRKNNRTWQAQIPYKGRQRYLGSFRKKSDAQAAYDKAAARFGQIPCLPEIDKIWPTWEQEKARLARMDERPCMPIIYQQQDVHQERKFGLRPPEGLRDLVERMKGVDWLVRHCLLAFDDDSPAASRDIAIQSNGQIWTEKNESEGRRFIVQGRTSIHKDTGRVGITIYNPGFDEPRVLAEEVYHIVFGILQQTGPEAYRATQRWYENCLRDGMDPTIAMDEAFSRSMGLEESGTATGLPRSVVRHSRGLFSARGNVPDSVMKKLKME